MTDEIAEMEAALALKRKERELIEAKAAGGARPELKAEVRELRRQHRELRAARPAEEGVARPDPIEATFAVEEG
jgi:hypothetical protein